MRSSTRMNRKVLAGVAVAISLLGISAFLIWLLVLRPPASAFPAKVKQKISFVILYPSSNSKQYTVDRESVKYDESNKLLSYVMSKPTGGQDIIVSEQPAPDSFADIPEMYNKFTEKMLPISTFDSYLGKASITQPPQLQGDQTLVMYAKGTLFFARTKKLSPDEWRQFINDFEVVR